MEETPGFDRCWLTCLHCNKQFHNADEEDDDEDDNDFELIKMLCATPLVWLQSYETFIYK